MNRRRVSISGFLLSFFPFLYDFSPERCRSVRKSTNVAVPCVGVFLFYGNTGIVRFYGARSSRYDLRWRYLSLYVFTCRGARPTTSGGHIFLCLKKDMEERQTKGLQSRPLDSGFYTGVRRGDVRKSYEFALVQLTRFRPARGVLRTASTDSIVLHVMQRNCWNLKNNQTDL